MRRITKVSVLVIMVSVLGVFLAMAPGKVNAGMCIGATQSFGYGDTVTESCALDEDMECPEGDGLIVGADNITIDGNGYCMDGVDSGSCDSMPPRSGIFNYTYDNVVIKNLEVKNFCNGIWLYGNAGGNDKVYKNTIENCNIHDNGNENKVAQGIGLDYVYDSIIKKNNIHHNIGGFGAPAGGCGIYLCGGDRNKIIENIITDNHGSGMFIRCRPEYTEVYYNYVTGNLFGGIRLMCIATAYSTVEYNYSEENETHGITVGGPYNTIQYNISINNLDTTHDAPAIGGAPPFGCGILFCRSANDNEANFNTACGNEHSDIEDSTFSQTNSGKSNACDKAENWDDDGTAGCMYACDAPPVAGFSGKPVSGPVPLKVQFADESIGIIDTWSWDFDDGETGHERNPVHIYNDTGKYTVCLTVSGDGGTDTETKPTYINVTAIYAEFSADKTKGLVPFEVAFTDNSTSLGADIAEWHWDFGDDGTSEVQNPTHKYENVGSYDVSLTVVNNNGESDTKAKEDYIQAKSVIADFSAEGEPRIPELPREGFTPFTVQFTDESQLAEGKEIDSYEWDFGDTVTDPDPNPTHIYYLPEGENCRGYTVSLTVACGEEEDTTIKYDYIVVADPALANFSAEPTSGDAPLTVQFTNLSTGWSTLYDWDFGDGETSHEESPVHTYENPGAYTVSLAAIQPYWGSDIETKEGYILVTGEQEQVATPTFSPDSGTTFTDSLDVEISCTTSGASIYYTIDGSDPTESSTPYTGSISSITETTTIKAKAFKTAMEPSEVASATYTKTEEQKVATPTFSPDSGTTFTDSLDVEISCTTSGASIYYTIDGSDPTESSTPYTGSISITETTTIKAKAFKTAMEPSEVASATYTKTTGELNADFSGSPTTGPVPLTVNFTDSSTGDIDSYAWSFGDGGTSAEKDPAHTYTNSGTYTVSLTVSGSGESDIETKTGYITVTEPEEPPVADFFASHRSGDTPLTVNFTDFSTGNVDSWSWSFGDDGGESTEQNPTYTYENLGAYSVSLTVSGPGGSDTRTKEGYITVCIQAPWHFSDEPHDEWPWWWF